MDCYITRDGGKTWEAAHTRGAEGPGRRGKGMRWVHRPGRDDLVGTTTSTRTSRPGTTSPIPTSAIARSTDAGKTWYWQTGRPLRNTTYELAFDPETPGTIWGASPTCTTSRTTTSSAAGTIARGRGGVGISTDFGVTWKDTSEPGSPRKPITSVVVDPKSPRGEPHALRLGLRGGCVQIDRRRPELDGCVERPGAPRGNVRACRLILHRDGSLFCLVTALRKDRHSSPKAPACTGRPTVACLGVDQPVQPLALAQGLRCRPSQPGHLPRRAGRRPRPPAGRPLQDDRRRRNWNRIARKGDDCFGATVDPPAGPGLPVHQRRWSRTRPLAEPGRGPDLEIPGWPAVPQRPARHLRPRGRLDHLRLHLRRQRLAQPSGVVGSRRHLTLVGFVIASPRTARAIGSLT